MPLNKETKPEKEVDCKITRCCSNRMNADLNITANYNRLNAIRESKTIFKNFIYIPFIIVS